MKGWGEGTRNTANSKWQVSFLPYECYITCKWNKHANQTSEIARRE